MKTIGNVKAWEETVIIPTYPTSKPDKNPLFFEKRVYQGSSGKVYPLAVTEKIFDEKVDQEYTAVYLENEYLKVMILPELGGRIQRAYDKTNDYDFVYYNHVIKPALVGLTGPWISGGIEFNWPQHHRPTTYSPTEYTIEHHEDGRQTVWVSEIDQMYGTKGMAGFTLHPDKAYIEITGKVFNRTDLPQTFLWWANPAVPANDHTASIFPPDVNAVMDHGKRAVSTFPIATDTYYKYDYSEGIDISKYKNVVVPTSYMAHHSNYDFIGNYDEQKQAGLLHVADHHVSPGKKQWVWGNGDFGQAWDRSLTDEDGPYVELMTGVFTDNQPDFTWLKPYEEKEFKQFFMPYKGVGYVKNATIDAAVNLEFAGDTGHVIVYATQIFEEAQVQVTYDEKIILDEVVTLNPKGFKTWQFDVTDSQEKEHFSVTVYDKDMNELVSYTVEKETIEKLPEPAEAIGKPEDLKTTEELFLAATHLEQHRHATLNPEDYYLEGLARDKTDIRLNNGYGQLLYRYGQFEESETFLKEAVLKQTWKSPNPLYGEPLFNLALAQKRLGKTKEAYDHFYKATWNKDTKGQAFYQLACLANNKGDLKETKEFLRLALHDSTHNMKAKNMTIAFNRQLGLPTEQLIRDNFTIDSLDLATHFEQYKLTGDLALWQKTMRGSVNNYLEIAWDYFEQGFVSDAIEILTACPEKNPMVHYYLAYMKHTLDLSFESDIKQGENASTDYCFPNKLADQIVLSWVIKVDPQANFAKYYLGNLFYDKKRWFEAIDLWESAASQLSQFPTVFRNLSFAYFNKKQDVEKALNFIEKAFKLNPTDARVLLERDQLLEKVSTPITKRLELLEAHPETLALRDDLFVEYLTMLNNTGQYDKVLRLMETRQFHPWEGGEGRVSSQYMYALIELAKPLIHEQPETALQLLNKTLTFPHNLGEGKLPTIYDTISYYYLGKTYEVLGDTEKATHYFEMAVEPNIVPESALYYHDQPSDTIFYQGLAHEALGNNKKAKACYFSLVAFGEKHFYDEVTYDYFAVSLPITNVFDKNMAEEHRSYCQYLLALGKIGLGNKKEGKELLETILRVTPNYQGAIRHMNLLTK